MIAGSGIIKQIILQHTREDTGLFFFGETVQRDNDYGNEERCWETPHGAEIGEARVKCKKDHFVTGPASRVATALLLHEVGKGAVP